jgi:hypothetical protein
MKGFPIPAKFILMGVLFFSFSSCFQYPEGPIFTVQTREERLAGNWFIDEVTDANGNDITSEYSTWTLNVEASKSTSNSSFSFFKDAILYSFGTYDFAEHGDQLIIAYSEYQSENVGADIVQKFYEIRRLTDKWFYYTDDLGNEFHWKKY